MNNKQRCLPPLLLLSVLLLTTALPGVFTAVSGQAGGSIPIPGTGVVNITTTISPVYTVFNPSVPESVKANITLTSLTVTSPATITINHRNEFSIRSITAQALLKDGTIVPLSVVIIKQTAGDIPNINLPLSRVG